MILKVLIMVDDIRRSQLAGVFGPGSLRIMVGGVSMICGSLDLWLSQITKQNPKVKNTRTEGLDNLKAYNDNEWKFNEYRLKEKLQQDYFIFPPQYREQKDWAEIVKNAEIVIPYFLFPRFMYCSNNVGPDDKICGRLKPKQATYEHDRVSEGLECDECTSKAPLYQVNIITICDNGHIDDFPWFEWAHYNSSPTQSCNEFNLQFKQILKNGTPTQQVLCSICNAKETLEDCFYSLTNNLPNFKCRGNSPWFGSDKYEKCEETPKAIYRSGSSVYRPVIFTSLYVPLESENNNLNKINDAFMEVPRLQHERIRLTRNLLRKAEEMNDNEIQEYFIEQAYLIHEDYFEETLFTVEEIATVLRAQAFNETSLLRSKDAMLPTTSDEFKEIEYKVLSKSIQNNLLQTREQLIDNYSEEVKKYIEKIVVVDKLIETKVLYDFTRKDGVANFEDFSTTKLWENSPDKGERWLPGVQNIGEGIFIVFNKDRIENHSKNPLVIDRLSKINYSSNQNILSDIVPSLDLVFVHTFSHLLINEMTTYSGYNAASISERLYVDQKKSSDMCGLLVYTASGDEEGTLGGISRLVSPDIFSELFMKALKNAMWCSTDPICNQVVPQGPYSLNLGACHSCALLPETSCNLMNSYLDRGVVVGTQEERNLGLININNFII